MEALFRNFSFGAPHQFSIGCDHKKVSGVRFEKAGQPLPNVTVIEDNQEPFMEAFWNSAAD